MQLNSRTISGTDGPHLLIIAGVHGDEFEPMVAVRRSRRWSPTGSIDACFSNWKDHDAFESAFARPLKDLRAESGAQG